MVVFQLNTIGEVNYNFSFVAGSLHESLAVHVNA